MKNIALGICFGVLLVLLRSLPLSHAIAQQPATSALQYRIESLPNATVHILTIPRSIPLTVALSPTLDRLESLAESQDAIAAINAGFFDPINGRSTSFISVGGEQVADPRQNDRLMQNPNLAPYLEQILDRSEFRQYRCGEEWQAAIAPHSAPIPANCTSHLAIGAGPQLLPELTVEAEAFVDEAAGRDAIGLRQPNARTAIGLTASGDVVWVMVAQRSEAPATSGFSLIELADWLDRAGLVQALNFDGGSSSSFYYRGETFYGKVNEQGERVERSIKSALLLSTPKP